MGSPLFEALRPKALGEVVGQRRAVSCLERIAARGALAGRAYWLAAPSGTGKTTLAKIIADLVTDDPIFVTEHDASLLTPFAIQGIEAELWTRGWGQKGGKAVIINEAHGLRKDTVRQLLVTLERLPGHAIVVFTTTAAGHGKMLEACEDAGPLVSRCLQIPMDHAPVDDFADHVMRVAEENGLGGAPRAAFVSLAIATACNMRAMIQAVEAGEMQSPDTDDSGRYTFERS